MREWTLRNTSCTKSSRSASRTPRRRSVAHTYWKCSSKIAPRSGGDRDARFISSIGMTRRDPSLEMSGEPRPGRAGEERSGPGGRRADLQSRAAQVDEPVEAHSERDGLRQRPLEAYARAGAREEARIAAGIRDAGAARVEE